MSARQGFRAPTAACIRTPTTGSGKCHEHATYPLWSPAALARVLDGTMSGYSCGTMPSRDTSTTAHARQREAFRRMTSGQRVAMAAEMSDEIRAVTEAGIRHRHPAYADDEVRAGLAAIVLGREEAARRRARRVTPGP